MDAHLSQIRFQTAQIQDLLSSLDSLRAEAAKEDCAVLDRCIRRMQTLERALIELREVLREHTEDVTGYKRQLSHRLDDLGWDIHSLF